VSLKVAVVGAGAFGGWTALELRRRGAEVTLFDTWGPANPRSSSGGESRVIRGVYGADRTYLDLVPRAFRRWREFEAQRSIRLFHPTGVLWLFAGEDAYARRSIPHLANAGLVVEQIPVSDCAARFDGIGFDRIGSVFYEPYAGFIAARDACREVLAAFCEAGGTYHQRRARPDAIRAGRMAALRLDDGTTVATDAFVFATGPWLAECFPDLLNGAVRSTRQEVFYFGWPESGVSPEGIPIWVEMGEDIMYGVPLPHGVKVATDTRGSELDPTADDRVASPERLAEAREHLGRRIPALARAPLVESRVCQYENSPDGHFLADQLPGVENVWILGGGSGHGFKFAPVLGEDVALSVTGGSRAAGIPLDVFGLERLGRVQAAVTQFDRNR
jgi:glycine/D-amino acid oxidase-like deaminating enzyme